MKKNTHFVVPKGDFDITQGMQNLTLYQVSIFLITLITFGGPRRFPLGSVNIVKCAPASKNTWTLVCMQFNTKQAKHYFCKTCGVQSFYVPRSNPDGIAVTAACIDLGTLEKVIIEACDGEHWEEFMEENKNKFRQMSRPTRWLVRVSQLNSTFDLAMPSRCPNSPRGSMISLKDCLRPVCLLWRGFGETLWHFYQSTPLLRFEI